MTRRLWRTGIQFGIIAIIVLFVIFLLDDRFRVLPAAIHNHLPAHHPGLVLTDITVKTCSSVNPFSSCDLPRDQWQRIEKELSLDKGYFSKAYLHVQRKKEEDLLPEDEVIFDIKLGRLPPAAAAERSKDEKWESKPAGIWVKKSAKRHLKDFTKVVTGVDVLFGVDAVDPRSNWQVQDLPLLLDGHDGAPEARLTIRKGPVLKIEKPTPRIRKDGKYKIMQVADLHFSTGTGSCRDPMPPERFSNTKCEADPQTIEFIERMIIDEKPDFVVLTGDQINGETSPDAQTGIFKYAEIFARHKIPYAAVFGNHDDGGNLSLDESMAIMDGLPYSMSTAGPADVDGVGNYIVEILARGSSPHSALTLYMLDSHGYSPDEHKYPGYAWIKPSQIAWFKESVQALKKKHREYTHIHMDLAFFHIPLPEYRNKEGFKFVGNWAEPPTSPNFNTHFKDALVEQGILLASCGHDHVNDYCLPATNKDGQPALWMCYGGGVGFGGYGGYNGYHRRMRFFDIDMNEARITTYKRMEWGDTEKRVDEQIVVDGGRVVVDL